MSLSEHELWDSAIEANLVPDLESLRDRRVLELGCGRGLLTRHLASFGVKVTGLDLHPSDEWKEHAGGFPRYVVGRGERLPFRDDSFDAVVSCSTLQYQDHRDTFSEMIRVTRDGGILYLHENMPSNPFIWVYRCLRRIRARGDPAEARYLSTIRGYFRPRIVLNELPFRELRLVRHQYFHFISALGSRAPRSALTRWMLAVDNKLLQAVPILRRYAWFCACRLEIRKSTLLKDHRVGKIGRSFRHFKETKNPVHMVRGMIALFREGRTLEALYGVACFAFRKPMLVDAEGVDAGTIEACLNIAKELVMKGEQFERRLKEIKGLPSRFMSRPELIVPTPSGWIVGEYSEVGRSARIFHVVDGRPLVANYYDRCEGVRHLHTIAAAGEGTFLVSTGDSSKFLDEWQIAGREIRFTRRLMRHFAGFTAYAKVPGALYYGTDFSERPNYLLRFQDRRKFYLPRPSYRQYVYSMATHADRYVVCCCKSIYGASSIAVFDAAVERFVYCAST